MGAVFRPVVQAWSSGRRRLVCHDQGPRSGSVLAQKLLFKYSLAGDLTSYFSAYFDTQVGTKRDVNSYLNILQILKLKAECVMFLSDIKEELDAANQAGINVGQLVRKDNVDLGQYSHFKDFSEIKELI